MKKYLLALVTLCLFGVEHVNSQNWAWMHGSIATGQQGSYGTPGVAAPTNVPGGRTAQSFWKDNSGNFWMFGGEGVDGIGNNGYLSDLWSFNPTTVQWTYVKGNGIIGQPGVYGTQGSPTNLNNPGGRSGAAYWTDANGNFWMFGGYGFDGSSGLGYLNDLWLYNTSTNMWVWQKGSSIVNAAASHGTIYVASPSNNPGGRKGAHTWIGSNGDLYLFGGYGVGTNFGSLNDFWVYSIANGNWTWIGGSATANVNGVYGTLNVTAPSNQPGARANGVSWKDQSGNFWLFSGDGFDASSPAKSYLNDLWVYSVGTGVWTWKGGSNIVTQAGVYGTQGVASTTNMPGSRMGAYSWADGIGNLWLVGGDGIGSVAATVGGLSDVWKYNYTNSEWMWVNGPSLTSLPSIYGSQYVSAATNRVGGRNSGAQWIDAGNNLWLFGGQGLASSATVGRTNDLWRNLNCFISPITLTVIAKDTVICAGESTSLTVSGHNNYLWAVNGSTLDNIVITPLVTTIFSVSTTDAKGCVYTATFKEFVDPCNSLSQNNAELQFNFYPQPFTEVLHVQVPGDYKGATITIRNISGQKVLTQVLTTTSSEIRLESAKGLYFYEITADDKVVKTGKLSKQ